jgi:hypothetical protein
MKYSIRKVVKGFSSVYDTDVWEVLKTPTAGDPYLIATYKDPALARWCLGSFHVSLEVSSQGGFVEQNEHEVLPPGMNRDGMPDELVW